jgi:hypothetical protein
MIFHGTDARYLDDILTHGLRPWNEFKEGSNWAAIPTRPGLVYLSEVYGLYYAQGAGDATSDMALIEIDESELDPSNFYPDEDFIAQLFWEAKSIGEEIPTDLAKIEDVATLTRLIDPAVFQSMAGSCRVHFGNASYMGTIPPAAFRRHAVVPHNKQNSVLHALSGDPALSMLNTLLVGERYRSLCDFVISDKRHPLAALSLREYLALPTVIVETTPGQYERVDGLTRERLCRERGIEENRSFASRDEVQKFHNLVRRLNRKATAVYNTRAGVV